jgi:hypothetical protein
MHSRGSGVFVRGFFLDFLSMMCIVCRPMSQGYSILLIITDGVINDMENTISAIISAAASLPLRLVSPFLKHGLRSWRSIVESPRDILLLTPTHVAFVCEQIIQNSILIVGVGAADFSAMDVLDGDDERLHNSRGIAQRDIVQFVPLRQFQVQNMVETKFSHAIAEALLEEIPSQLLGFMESAKIRPNATAPSVEVYF